MTTLSIPPNRLARIVSADGAPIDVLVRDAEQRMADAAPRIAASLDGLVTDLLALCRRSGSAIQADARAVRRAVLHVVEIAAVARRNDIVGVALELCDQLDGWISHGDWRDGAIATQAEGLGVLTFRLDLSPDQRTQLIAALNQLAAGQAHDQGCARAA